MSAVIRWEDPPPSVVATAVRRRPRRSQWEPVADALREQPGRWAVVYEGESRESRSAVGALVTHIRLGQVRCFTPTGDFDATSRVRDGKVAVYARYVGEATP